MGEKLTLMRPFELASMRLMKSTSALPWATSGEYSTGKRIVILLLGLSCERRGGEAEREKGGPEAGHGGNLQMG